MHFDKEKALELISLLALAVTKWDKVSITAFRDTKQVNVTTYIKNVRAK